MRKPRKPTRKPVSKSKVRHKKPYDRKHVMITKDVNNMLRREYEDYDGSVNCENGIPLVILLGENKRHVVKDYEKLVACMDGCGEMPTITGSAISNAYIRLAKRGLTGCAIARVGYTFDNSSLWGTDSGSAIYLKNMDYILSIDERGITAATVYDKYVGDIEMPESDDDYDEDGNYVGNYSETNLKELAIRIVK